MRIRFSGALGRAMTTATVAASSDRRMKKCETWKPWSSEVLVEISELIIQPRAQRVLARGLGEERGGGGRRGRPGGGDQSDNRRAGDADDIRERPREAVEAFIERRRQHVLAAVVGDECGPHLIASHPLRQPLLEIVPLLLQSVTGRSHRTAAYRGPAAPGPAHDVPFGRLGGPHS